MTNASASKPRIKNARMNATTICSTKSRAESCFLGGVAAGAACVLVLGGEEAVRVIEGFPKDFDAVDPAESILTNVPDFTRIGNPVYLPAKDAKRNRLARKVH